MSHAILAPSSASRWMACTPSARLELKFPNKSSVYADEGTLAHAVGEAIIRFEHGLITKKQYESLMLKHKKSEHYSEELLQHCQNYADYVSEYVGKDSILLVEQKLDMTNYVPEGSGTGDILIMQDKLMDFIDLKFGKGVPVFAENNKQLMLYALGAYNDFGFAFETEVIRMHIYQPRLDSVSMWEISVVDLIHWAETELKEKAQMAFKGEGEFVPGKHCGFCKAKAQCRALRDYNMELAALAFKEPDLLEDEELLEVLEKKPLFDNWIKAVGEYLLEQAKNGRKFVGYKLVHGKSNRLYGDPLAVENVLKKKGITDIYTEPKLVGITELNKRIGKNKFSELVEPLLIKPEGKPTLVPNADKRPEMASPTEASDVFNDSNDLI